MFRLRLLADNRIGRLKRLSVAVIFCFSALHLAAQTVGISTNLLYDAALVPNLGVEVGIGTHFSVKANYMWAWWSRNVRHRYWRIEGGDVEARWWSAGRRDADGSIGRRGFHVGVYGGIVTYDLEFGGKGWQAPRWSYTGGVSAGYAVPIARRLTLDFNVGVGFLNGKYYEYEPHADGRYWWTATKQRNWIGPTKAEISLVWNIGRCHKGNDKHDVGDNAPEYNKDVPDYKKDVKEAGDE